MLNIGRSSISTWCCTSTAWSFSAAGTHFCAHVCPHVCTPGRCPLTCLGHRSLRKQNKGYKPKLQPVVDGENKLILIAKRLNASAKSSVIGIGLRIDNARPDFARLPVHAHALAQMLACAHMYRNHVKSEYVCTPTNAYTQKHMYTCMLRCEDQQVCLGQRGLGSFWLTKEAKELREFTYLQMLCLNDSERLSGHPKYSSHADVCSKWAGLLFETQTMQHLTETNARICECALYIYGVVLHQTRYSVWHIWSFF